MRFTIPPPEGTGLSRRAGYASQQALSPDGRVVAFVADESGVGSIWVRPLEALTAQKLDRTEEATFPFWSLFESRMTPNAASYHYAVSRDGQRFLVREPVSDLDAEPLHVILNWPALLGQ